MIIERVYGVNSRYEFIISGRENLDLLPVAHLFSLNSDLQRTQVMRKEERSVCNPALYICWRQTLALNMHQFEQNGAWGKNDYQEIRSENLPKDPVIPFTNS